MNETLVSQRKYRVKNDQKIRGRSLILPWQFKILAYIISFSCMSFSIIFTVFKGINFGDETCGKWLSSFVVSIFASCLITQPIQVALFAVLLVLLFRKSEKETLEKQDPYDNGQPINENFAHVPKSNFTENNKKLQEEENHILKYEAEKDFLLAQKKFKKHVRLSIVYMFFLTLLFVITFTKQNQQSYIYKKSLEQDFKIETNLKKVSKSKCSKLMPSFIIR